MGRKMSQENKEPKDPVEAVAKHVHVVIPVVEAVFGLIWQ